MTEIKKSVVKNVQSTGTWSTKREPIKTYYKFEVTMENGDSGEYSSISQDQEKFQIGNEVEYIYIGGEYPKIKPHYANSNGQSYNYSNENQIEAERIARSVAIKLACSFCPTVGITHMIDIVAYSDSFTAYILEGKLPFPKSERPPLRPAEVQESNLENDPF